MKLGPAVPRVVLLLLSALAAACSRSGGAARVPDGAVDAATADGAGDLASDPPSSAADAGEDRPGADTPDASAAAVLPPELLAYRAFLVSRADAYQARWTECFGAPASLLTPGEQQVRGHTERLLPSFRLGLVVFDARAAATCLAGIQGASCEQVAEMYLRHEVKEPGDDLPGCRHVLLGRVPDGRACLTDADCLDRTKLCGATEPGDRCRVCRPAPTPLPIGADCSSGSCPEGSRCRLADVGAPSLQCTQPGQRGSFCLFQGDCGAGLFCSRTVADDLEGTCQPHRAGDPCDGEWQCLSFLACLGVGPATQGRCGQPKRAGEPCQTSRGDVSQIPQSDCALLLACLDLDGQGPRCVVGSGLGEPCGEMPSPGGGRAWLGCATGFCERPFNQATGRCRLLRAAGDACQHDGECATPMSCAAATPAAGSQPRFCRLPAAPAGLDQLCDALDRACGEGLFCRRVDPDGFSTLATCRPLKRVGEPCREDADLCEALSACSNGLCTPC